MLLPKARCTRFQVARCRGARAIQRRACSLTIPRAWLLPLGRRRRTPCGFGFSR
ncbi:hypothetical protein GQ55_5G519000 [Panicum hallii var. hallii]|uniref:Uncharacterized protein n=1 Tax=Panicum hallii var. hallii TaxID=1504633 RepID=A0A2T7DSK1_9POAL|nr:hypothetical protein GQ55_5G519000 [Panicum hallii var. hallii]